MDGTAEGVSPPLPAQLSPPATLTGVIGHHAAALSCAAAATGAVAPLGVDIAGPDGDSSSPS